MITLFSLILITSIWVLGLTIVTQEHMLLYSVREWANKKHEAGNKWMEPLILCHWCMSSIHSVVGYSFAVAIKIIIVFEWRFVFMYPLVVMGSSLFNGIVWGIHRSLENKTAYFENMEQLTHWDIVDRKKNHQQAKSSKQYG